MSHFIKSLTDAGRGIAFVWKEERNFRIEIIVGAIILALAYCIDFTFFERAFLCIGVVIVLLTEILNTAIEDLCNKVEPSFDPAIGKIKDMLAGFVLVAALLSVILFAIVITSHFFSI